MVLVAVVAIMCALAERRARFQRIALANAEALRAWRDYGGFYSLSWIFWHEEMRQKYERAARRPWCPVAPDPPGPFDQLSALATDPGPSPFPAPPK